LRERVLEFDSSNPFRNLPQSFLIHAHGKTDETFAGIAKAIAGCGHNSGLIEQLGREVGNRTNLDVLNLQQQVYDVKRDLSDARYGYLLTQLKLAALAGELTENDLTTLIRR